MSVTKILMHILGRELVTRKCPIVWRNFQKSVHFFPCRTIILNWKSSEHHVSAVRRCATYVHNKNDTREDIAMKHELKLETAAQNIFEICKKNDVMVISFGIESIRSCLVYLSEMNLQIEEIEEILIKSPKVFMSPNMKFMTEFLREYGFSLKQISSIYKQFPGIFDMDLTSITELLEILRKVGFHQYQLLKLVAYNPSVILLKTDEIVKRITELKELFKSRDILHLIVKSPFILTEDINVIHSKFNYVFHNMGITQRQMMYSNLFSHSLEHVRNRHVFLVKAGLFKIVKKDKGEISQNPKLQDIIDTSDKQFAKRYGNMTELEYQTFTKMMKRERENDDDFDFLYMND